jgi:methyl-accepting chemotaxis protein
MSIRIRIAIAMSLVLLTASITAAVSWAMSDTADDAATAAVAASQRASWAAGARAHIRGYIGEASDITLALLEGESAEVSAEYGDLMGSDRTVRQTLEAAGSLVAPGEATALMADWDAVRAGVTDWVNSESADAGQALVLIASEDRLRASTGATPEAPATLAGMATDQKRAQVRAWVEALTDGRLRAVAQEAEQEAHAAEAKAVTARRAAAAATLAMLALNVLVALGAGIWLYRTIATPLAKAQRVAVQVAAGDFAAQFPPASADEIGTLLSTVERMRDAVLAKVSALREVAGAVLVTSESLHAAVMRVSDLPNDDPGLPQTMEEMDASSRLLNDLAVQMIAE